LTTSGERHGWPRVLTGLLAAYAITYTVWTFVHWGGHRVIVSDVASWPVVAGAVLLAWRKSNDLTGPARLAWRWIAFAAASWLVGEGLWFYEEVIRHRNPFPSIADPFYLLFYPLVFVGLMLMPVQEPRRRDRMTMLLDAGIVMVAALMTIWYLVIQPTVADSHSPWTTIALSVAYPAGDLVLFGGILRILLRGPRRGAMPSLRLLALGLMCLVVADITFARLDLAGTYQPASVPDAMWVIAMFFVAAAAYVADRESAARQFDYEQREREVSLIPFGAVFVGLGLLIYQAAAPGTGSLLTLTIGVFGLAVLVGARQLVLQHDIHGLIGELEHLVSTDPLTGLASRRRFFDHGNRMVAVANENGTKCAVIIADLDGFKRINDQHGHAEGDAVLKAVAGCYRGLIAPDELAARLGGDEFACIVHADHEHDPDQFVCEVGRAVTSGITKTGDGAPLLTSLSFGVAISNGVSSLDDLLLIADTALYRAKRERIGDQARPTARIRAVIPPAATPN